MEDSNNKQGSIKSEETTQVVQEKVEPQTDKEQKKQGIREFQLYFSLKSLFYGLSENNDKFIAKYESKALLLLNGSCDLPFGFNIRNFKFILYHFNYFDNGLVVRLIFDYTNHTH